MNRVQGFWNTEACGTYLVEQTGNRAAFFKEYRDFRYRTEWHIPELVPFADFAGQEVLEIGCGNGADGARFARNGAHYTGVDLTPTAVAATKEHFGILKLEGTFQTENAEALSFGDAGFDLVYSWGVLHHTPNPEKTFREVHRVLRPGGKAIIMLYHRKSFNYYIRILTYMRLKVLWKALRKGGLRPGGSKTAAGDLQGVRGNQLREVYDIHYDNLCQTGWSYLKASNFVHHCTDGPECPFAYTYTRKELQQIFSNFSEIQLTVAHFPLRKYRIGKWIPLWLEKQIAKRIGWNIIAFLEK